MRARRRYNVRHLERMRRTFFRMRILLVEDDRMIADGVRKALKADGCAVDWVQDGDAALTALGGEAYDLLLLDLGLPKRDGIDVLRTLRARGLALPVLILTARDAVADRVKGLDAGADDYLVKPFDLDELAARMRALIRRQSGRSESVIRHGALTLDPASHQVTLDGAPVALSAREFALLEALLARPGAVLSKSQLEEKMYGWGEEIGSNTVEVYIHALRKKLGSDLIRNVRGLGYMVVKEA
ncbi:DNA-binding response regulator [Burkholderia thailandensis E264]|uniref:DNA-binding response regulator n=2 Tax=Burkholderia thailandensis TaxID=57975 RepID=Q2T0S0_BURTA|nr:DNA-binding response regulator [Burkholderia thailandensis E264]